MERLYAIYAYEDIYGGLHGMNLSEVVKCSEDEVYEIGSEMSLDVMDSYSYIQSALEEEAQSYGYECDSDEYYQFLDDVREENIAYEIYLISDEKAMGKDIRALEDEFYNNQDSFIKKYCEKQII